VWLTGVSVVCCCLLLLLCLELWIALGETLARCACLKHLKKPSTCVLLQANRQHFSRDDFFVHTEGPSTVNSAIHSTQQPAAIKAG
jgi:hypothetical protein